MSLLDDLFGDDVPADLSEWRVVLTAEARAALTAFQDAMGAYRFRVEPVALTDGRFMLPATIPSDARLYPGIAQITPAMLAGVSVAPAAEIDPLMARSAEL